MAKFNVTVFEVERANATATPKPAAGFAVHVDGGHDAAKAAVYQHFNEIGAIPRAVAFTPEGALVAYIYRD